MEICMDLSGKVRHSQRCEQRRRRSSGGPKDPSVIDTDEDKWAEPVSQ